MTKIKEEVILRKRKIHREYTRTIISENIAIASLRYIHRLWNRVN